MKMCVRKDDHGRRRSLAKSPLELQERLKRTVAAHAEIDDVVAGELFLELPRERVGVIETPALHERTAEDPDPGSARWADVCFQRSRDPRGVGKIGEMPHVTVIEDTNIAP